MHVRPLFLELSAIVAKAVKPCYLVMSAAPFEAHIDRIDSLLTEY
jgi:hypothetical protein